MKKKYLYYKASSLMEYVNDYIFDEIYILIGEDETVITEKGFSTLQYVWGKFWANNHAHVIQEKNGFTTETLYILLQKTNIKHLITGALQQKISQKNLKNLKIIIPEKKEIKKFNELNKPLIELYRNNTDEIKNLEKIRDILLPKLMNGEINVSKIKIIE